MTTKAYTLFASLIPRLQAVRVANGYATDAGLDVMPGQVPRGPSNAYPYIRLHEIDAAVESTLPHRPHAKLRVQFMAEGFITDTSAATMLATGHKLVGDIKKALFGDAASDLNGQAIDARLEGYRVQPPEEGSDVVIAQVRGSYSFTDHFDAP